MEFDFSRSSPHLFAATLGSSCLLATSLTYPGTSFAWLALSPCPLGVSPTTLLLPLGFGTRDGRGSGMRYFRALACVPPTPRLRVDRPTQSRPSHSGLRTAGPLRPPRLTRRRNPWSLQQASAGAAALPEGDARGRAPGAGLELLSSAGLSTCWGASFQRSGLAGFGSLRFLV